MLPLFVRQHLLVVDHVYLREVFGHSLFHQGDAQRVGAGFRRGSDLLGEPDQTGHKLNWINLCVPLGGRPIGRILLTLVIITHEQLRFVHDVICVLMLHFLESLILLVLRQLVLDAYFRSMLEDLQVHFVVEHQLDFPDITRAEILQLYQSLQLVKPDLVGRGL